MWCHFLPVPFVVLVISVTFAGYQFTGVRIHRETFPRSGVDHMVCVLAELPGPGVAALRTPADVDVVCPVPGHAPLPAAELTLRVESKHLGAAEAVTPADPHLTRGMAAVGVKTRAGPGVTQLAPKPVRRKSGIFVKYVVCDFLHEPVKTLTILLLLHFKLLGYVPHVH